MGEKEDDPREQDPSPKKDVPESPDTHASLTPVIVPVKRKIREGRDNLVRRADWFRRRSR